MYTADTYHASNKVHIGYVLYRLLIIILIVLIIMYNNSVQSKASAKAGMIDSARDKGVCAAYLSVAAIVVALVIAILTTGLSIALFYYYLARS